MNKPLPCSLTTDVELEQYGKQPQWCYLDDCDEWEVQFICAHCRALSCSHNRNKLRTP